MKALQQISLIALLALAPAWAAQAQQPTPDLRLFSGDKDDPLRAGAAGAAGAAAAAPVQVAEAGVAADDSAVGSATRGWVDLQASGTAAVGAARPLPGEVADAVYTRYLKSFTQPIPAEFKRQSGGGSEGQGGSGNSGR